MSYIGNTAQTQAFTPAVDYFSGNASTTAFTLSRPVASVAQVEAVIDNVVQNPSSAYTVSNNTITFTSAPLSGTNNIYVRYTSPITQVIAPGQGTVTATSMASSTGTGAGVFQTSPTITTPTIDTITSAASTALTLKSAGTTAVTIDTSQNVGIGTTSPNSLLTVQNGNILLRSAVTTGALNSYNLGFSATATGGAAAYVTSYRENANEASSLVFGNWNGSSSGERMRIDSSGNVGIGTSSPSTYANSQAPVLVVGTGNNFATIQGRTDGPSGATNAVSYGGSYQANPINGARMFFGAAGGAGQQGLITFCTKALDDNTTQPLERMRIDSSGNVGIGTSSPAGRLHVSSTSDVEVRSATTGASYATFRLKNSTQDYSMQIRTDQSNAWTLRDETAGANRLLVDTSGGLILVGSTAQKATGTTWSNPSDQRLKDNIRDYAKGMTELMQVRVREWEYNGKGGTIQGTKGLGVVADEVMIVLPDTVENYEAKLNMDDEEVTAIKKFDATEITWLLVKTAQETKALIDTQAETINALTARIVALEGK